jgi:hypothetical protein
MAGWREIDFTTLTTPQFYLQSAHYKFPCFHLGSVVLAVVTWCRSASPPVTQKLRPCSERTDRAAAAASVLSTSEVGLYFCTCNWGPIRLTTFQATPLWSDRPHRSSAESMIPDDPAMPLITRAEVHGHDTCPTGTFSTFLGQDTSTA